MANTLLTGISGLRSHQRMLEVIGNNLANLNTTAFKSSRTLFADLMYETHRGPSSSSGNIGGINPIQVGTGVRVGAVDRQFTEGTLEQTGGELDFGIAGAGFFVLENSNDTYYSRAGAFTLDSGGYLTDIVTGNYVQRFGDVGEPSSSTPGFQIAGDNRIRIPIGTAIIGQISTNVNVVGNLRHTSDIATAQVVESAAPFLSGGAAVTPATLLNAMDITTTGFVAGDSLDITGNTHAGTVVDEKFDVDGTTTVQDLLDAMNSHFPESNFELDSAGQIVGTSNLAEASKLNVQLGATTGNTGVIDLSNHSFLITTTGQNAEVIAATARVYDEQGGGHTVNLAFTREAPNEWNMSATLDDDSGTVIDGSVEGIRFNTDGTFAGVTGTGTGDAAITLQFTGFPQQTIQMNLGELNTTVGLTQVAEGSRPVTSTDGKPSGTLSGVSVDGNGIIYGTGTNNLLVPVAQLAMATFQNEDGLISVGNNYYQYSVASGTPDIGTPGSGQRGRVESGQLESSNVDLALEFTRLIVAQRGFSANARTITVTDEILQELNSLIR